jgi:succinate-semialdehyde dehydrogenase/glutarate-semialdehyde dehydrogenase
MYGYRKMYVGGKLRDAENGARLQVTCPATGEVIGEVAKASKKDAQEALVAARDGFEIWRKTPLQERIDAMHRLRELVAKNEVLLRECVMNEHGKTYGQAEEDWATVVDSLQFYTEEITRMRGEILPDPTGAYEHKIVLEPLGVAVGFLAWNFPLLNLAFKLAPALAAGCSVILRPSQETPLSAYIIGELCHQVGLPAGVVNILTGSTSEVANTLSSSEIPSLLTLIGSTETGISIMRTGATSIKHYSMELGGNAPVLVFADADLDLAADVVTNLKFANTGQICVTPNRIYVAQSVHDAFVNKVVARSKRVVMGHGRNSDATMGPLINAAAQARIEKCIKDAIAAGASCAHGGSVPADLKPGFYFQPTVLINVREDMTVVSNEIFGPVVSIMSFSDEEDVLRRANTTMAGLSAFIFTKDAARINWFSRELRYGEIQVNGVRYGVHFPHGGIRQSGIGHDESHFALHDYLSKKRISTSQRVC